MSAPRAIVTGAAQGLGLAIARALRGQGTGPILLVDKDGERLASAVAELGPGTHGLTCDLSDPGAPAAVLAEAGTRMGGADQLVNAAADTARGSILDTDPGLFDRLIATNLRAPFFLIQQFARACIAAGHGGGVVNILSVVVHGGLPPLAPYAASKAGLANVTRNAAHTLAPHGIRVNGINVGWMETPGEDMVQRRFHGKTDGWLEAAGAAQPFGRLVQPEEVAAQAAFFLSPASGVVTGTVMDFDQRVLGIYPDTG